MLKLLSKRPARKQAQQDEQRLRVLDLRLQSVVGLPQSGAVGVCAEVGRGAVMAD